jgi:hypothetical protein
MKIEKRYGSNTGTYREEREVRYQQAIWLYRWSAGISLLSAQVEWEHNRNKYIECRNK